MIRVLDPTLPNAIILYYMEKNMFKRIIYGLTTAGIDVRFDRVNAYRFKAVGNLVHWHRLGTGGRTNRKHRSNVSNIGNPPILIIFTAVIATKRRVRRNRIRRRKWLKTPSADENTTAHQTPGYVRVLVGRGCTALRCIRVTATGHRTIFKLDSLRRDRHA